MKSFIVAAFFALLLAFGLPGCVGEPREVQTWHNLRHRTWESGHVDVKGSQSFGP